MSPYTSKSIHTNEERQRIVANDSDNFVLSDTDTVGQREYITEKGKLTAVARITYIKL